MDYLLFFWLQDYFMIVDFMTALMQVVNWKVGNMIQVLSNERKWTFFSDTVSHYVDFANYSLLL